MTRTWSDLSVLSLLALLLSPTTAMAQVQTGSIFVRAVDEQGASVPGVTVTLTSPVMPRPLVAVTDSTGVHRFPSLTFGTYEVRASLQGFRTIVRTGIGVVQNETVTLNLSMSLGALTEEITVRGEAPIIDTRNATVATNLDAMLLDTTPGGKDIWNILEYKIPGLVFNTPDVGGNQGGLQRAFTARGSENGQNIQLLNGVNVGDVAAIGYSMNYYEPATFENIQVSTGAQDISMGTSGTLINMVTRSGTNRFTGKTLLTYQGASTQWDNVDAGLQDFGFRPEANAVDYISNFNVQAGGPLIANRLFYFGSYNNQQTHVNVPGFPAIVPAELPQVLSGNDQDTTDIDSVTGKLNLALNGSNRLEAYGNYQWYDKPNRGAGANSTQDSASKEYDTFPIMQAQWNSVLSDLSFLDTKVSYNNTHFPLSQKTNLQPLFDASTGVQHLNRSADFLTFRRRLQVTSNWQYYIPEAFGARHEIKVGFDNALMRETQTDDRVDGLILRYNSLPTPTPIRLDIYGYPRVRERGVMNTAIYAQDSFSFDRMTVTAGMRWERVEGFLPEQTWQDTHFFPVGTVFPDAVNLGGGVREDFVVPSMFDRVDNAPLWHNWAPRLSVTYDLHGDGRTALKFSTGKYLDQIGTGTPGPNPNGTLTQRYGWNDQNGDLQFQRGNAVWDAASARYVGGEFGALQRTSVPGVGSAFDDERQRSYSTEYTLGVDHELFPAMRLSVSYIHREGKNVYDDIDVDLDRWNELYSPVSRTEQGRDGVLGTADDQTITVYQLNDPNYAVATVNRNDDRLGTTYNGVEVTLTKRFSDGWTFLGGYTYSKTTQDVESLSDPNDFFVNADGETSRGRRHIFKASGSYELPYQVLFGANMRVQSGLPITRTVSIEDLTQGDINVNAEPRGSVTLPKLFTLDIRAGRFFDVGAQRLELSMDVYNLTNANTVYNVRTNTGFTNIRFAGDPTQPVTTIPSFMSPTGFLGPRIIRFNATFSFGQ